MVEVCRVIMIDVAHVNKNVVNIHRRWHRVACEDFLGKVNKLASVLLWAKGR